ncbi:methyl-accepting chemotaxis protein [Aquibacillus sediminis]|uniref:methyl-accepting chemotaxis protein n=1 Tax=Aquibacillus sediminis TaxID=2574734 RepID=UPI0011085624|nr:methyl-accepting chemotaxis protein [Aquibacillus sediminis]
MKTSIRNIFKHSFSITWLKKLDKLPIRLRVIVSFSIVLLLLIVMSTVMYSKMRAVSNNDQQVMDLFLPIVIEANAINNDMLQTSKHVNELATTTMSVSQKILTDEINLPLSNIEESKQELQALIDQFEDQQLKENYQTFLDQWTKYKEIVDNVITASANGNMDVAQDETYKGEAYFDRANHSMLSIVSNVEQQINDRVHTSVQLNKQGTNWIFIISIGSILLTIGLIYFTVIMITKPLSTISDQVEKVASGDFTVAPLEQKTQDELGKLTSNFNGMTTSLREVLKDVIHTITHVTETADQITHSANETKAGVEQVATSVEKVSSDTSHQLESISAINQHMSETAVDMEEVEGHIVTVNSLSDTANKKAKYGQKDIDRIISNVMEMESSVHSSVNKLNSLVDKTNEIDSIVSVIHDVSTQTNLLALNAAIEAARAGEHGQGFAVVADEVKKLATQSADATDKISSILQSIQSETAETVDSMQITSESTAKGKELIIQAGKNFEQIVTSTTSVSEQAKIVAQHIERVTERTKNVVKTMQSVSEVSSQNTANVQTVAGISEETNAAMEEVTEAFLRLSKMSEQLNNKVNKFSVD